MQRAPSVNLDFHGAAVQLSLECLERFSIRGGGNAPDQLLTQPSHDFITGRFGLGIIHLGVNGRRGPVCLERIQPLPVGCALASHVWLPLAVSAMAGYFLAWSWRLFCDGVTSCEARVGRHDLIGGGRVRRAGLLFVSVVMTVHGLVRWLQHDEQSCSCFLFGGLDVLDLADWPHWRIAVGAYMVRCRAIGLMRRSDMKIR